jgi:DNA modification methylase
MLLNEGEEYKVVFADCIPTMAEMPPESVDMVVTSVPFPAMYSYTSLGADIGNSEGAGEMKLHFGFFYRQLSRVLKPGRVAVIHVMQIPRMKRTGGEGLFDFRGFNIRLGERAGLVYHYDWIIRKGPQSQAIRTKSHDLQFAGLERDRARSRGALGDYIIKFRAKGENAVPIDSKGQVSRDQWIEWAECCWDSIRETDTLNVREAKGEGDVKHLCALQLKLIEQVIRLYSNPGEIVFSPFAGIGSEGYMALKLGRRFYGCELKKEYYETCLRNLERAKSRREESQKTMFDEITTA